METSSEFDDGEDRVTKASLTIYLLVNWGRAQTWQGHSLQTSLLEVGNKANLVKGLQLLPRPAKLSSTGGQNGNWGTTWLDSAASAVLKAHQSAQPGSSLVILLWGEKWEILRNLEILELLLHPKLTIKLYGSCRQLHQPPAVPSQSIHLPTMQSLVEVTPQTELTSRGKYCKWIRQRWCWNRWILRMVWQRTIIIQA